MGSGATSTVSAGADATGASTGASTGATDGTLIGMSTGAAAGTTAIVSGAGIPATGRGNSMLGALAVVGTLASRGTGPPGSGGNVTNCSSGQMGACGEESVRLGERNVRNDSNRASVCDEGCSDRGEIHRHVPAGPSARAGRPWDKARRFSDRALHTQGCMVCWGPNDPEWKGLPRLLFQG